MGFLDATTGLVTKTPDYLYISVYIVGVPLNVVVAASLGVLAGLAWNYKDKTRREVIGIAAASVIAACALTAILSLIINHFYEVELNPPQMAPLALLIALFGPRWVPAVNERIGPWLDKIPFIGKRGA